MKAVQVWSPRPEQALKMTLAMGQQPREGAHADGGFQMTLQCLPRFFQFLNCNPASLLPGPEPPPSDCEPEREPPRPRRPRALEEQRQLAAVRTACPPLPPPPPTEKHKPLGKRTPQGPRLSL